MERTVKLGDASPIVIDLGSDGTPDFTVFLELTANSAGDHLYAGIKSDKSKPYQIRSCR